MLGSQFGWRLAKGVAAGALVSLVVFVGVAASSAATGHGPGVPPGKRDRAGVVAYWTPARVAHAG